METRSSPRCFLASATCRRTHTIRSSRGRLPLQGSVSITRFRWRASSTYPTSSSHRPSRRKVDRRTPLAAGSPGHRMGPRVPAAECRDHRNATCGRHERCGKPKHDWSKPKVHMTVFLCTSGRKLNDPIAAKRRAAAECQRSQEREKTPLVLGPDRADVDHEAAPQDRVGGWVRWARYGLRHHGTSAAPAEKFVTPT